VLQATTPSRRLTSRIKEPEDVWVLWQCDGREAVSRVRNISVGGLFIETARPRSIGAVSQLTFLVPEGQIRAEATVRHAKPESGVGLHFVAVTEDDGPKLAALLSRLRSLSRARR
jgi:PilZ domain-containing protein